MDFRQFFESCFGASAFNWQRDFTARVFNGEWHDSLPIPPGCGKTAGVLAMASYCQLFGNFPRRVVAMVDRAVVVDEWYNTAARMAAAMSADTDFGKICQKQSFSKFGTRMPLVARALRSGVDREKRNIIGATPLQPVVISSTLDQAISRLIFAGWGCSIKSRHTHAGLLARDSLLVIDEGHLANPAVNLIKNLIPIINAKKLGNIQPTRFLSVSATNHSGDSWDLTDTLAGDPRMVQRINAPRPVEYRKAKNLVDTLAKLSKEKVAEFKTVITVCNTVDTARKVFAVLKEEGEVETILLMGRIRPADRQKLLDRYIPRIVAGRIAQSNDSPLIVVATSTIEVGVNVDSPCVISEAAPLDCLVQRFGRCNRLGLYQDSLCVVVDPGKDCPVYGDVTQKVIEAVFPDAEKAEDEDDVDEVSARDLAELLEDSPELRSVSAETVFFNPAFIECLARCNDGGEPDITAVIHGRNTQRSNDVSVIFRKEFTAEMMKSARNPTRDEGRRDLQNLRNWVELCKPRSREILRLPLHAIYGVKNISDTSNELQKVQNGVLCFRYADGIVLPLNRVGPGQTVFLPCDVGLYDEYGFNPLCETPVHDVFHDKGIAEKPDVFRLHPNHVEEFKIANFGDLTEDTSFVNGMIAQYGLAGYAWKPCPDGLGVVCYRKEKMKNRRQTLVRHTKNVMKFARNFSSKLGFPATVVEDMVLAASLHDVGKLDIRVQQAFYGNSVPDLTKPLAKSGSNGKIVGLPRSWRHELLSVKIAEENDLADEANDKDLVLWLIGSHHGYHHGGVPFIRDDSFKPLSVDTSKMREILPVDKVTCQKSYCDEFGAAVDLGLYGRLAERYGHYNLAMMETVFRLADYQASK